MRLMMSGYFSVRLSTAQARSTSGGLKCMVHVIISLNENKALTHAPVNAKDM